MEPVDPHLRPEEIDRLVGEDWRLDELAEWLFHLMTCGLCREALTARHPVTGKNLLIRAFGSADHARFEGFDRASQLAQQGSLTMKEVMESFRKRHARTLEENAEAPSLIAELHDQPPARRNLLVLNHPRYRTLGVVVHLLAESESLWHGDPKEALHWAELALALLGRLDDALYGRSFVNDLRAEAWAYVGNAQRLLSRLHAAARSFDKAVSYLEAGTGSAWELATVARLKAKLLRDRRDFAGSVELLEVAREVYALQGDVEQEVRVLVAEGITHGHAGQLSRSVKVLTELWEWLRPEDVEPATYLAALQSLATSLAKVGRGPEALRLVPRIRRLARASGERLDLVRVDWLDGIIQESLGNIGGAARHYEEVREFFLAAGILYDAALVTLDLAAVCLEQGQHTRAAALAGEILALFRAEGIHREAVAALVVLEEALRRRLATAALLREAGQAIRLFGNRRAPASGIEPPDTDRFFPPPG